MVLKVEMGLTALFEQIVLASASFLIDFDLFGLLNQILRPTFPGFWSNQCKTRNPP